jgi:negative regulator of flagellin synthesis FlgM
MEIRNINNVRGIENNKLNNVNRDNVSRSSERDDVQISAEARKLAEEKKIQDMLRNAPDVREDRIAEVKAKLESGAYDTEEVLNDVAEKLMKVLGL